MLHRMGEHLRGYNESAESSEKIQEDFGDRMLSGFT